MSNRDDLARFRGRATVLCGVGLATAIAVACSQSADHPPSLVPVPALTVTASPTKLAADGSTTDVSIIATLDDNKPATGSVTVEVSNGELGPTAARSVSLELTNGRATVTLACNAATNAACVGQQTVFATFGSLLSRTTVEFTATATVIDGGQPITDAGAPDGDSGTPIADTGTPLPDTGTPLTDAGNPVSDAAATELLTLTASKPKLYSNVGDTTSLTALVRRAPDGGGLANVDVTFQTDHGALALGDAGTSAPMLVATTDSTGQATVQLRDQGDIGVANVTARRPTGLVAATSVQIIGVQQITYISTTCQGAPCTIMGVRGSGFNEQAQVTFQVVDSSALPVVGVNVSFSIANAPTGTTVMPTARTDANGRVTVNVSAGAIIGVFSVTATVIPGLVQADGPSIGIRGAKPSNRGFSLQCTPVNVGAYVSPAPPASFNITCNTKVVDRFNNPVGTGTPVNFKVEAGTIPNSVTTQAYTPAGTNANEGTGAVVFSTVGAFPPQDVAPFAAISQWPHDRFAEPTTPGTSPARNPRDGMVTVLAYVRGEEFFQDDNSNGTHDPNEMFIDQGEAFVDANDNNVWDQGEVFIDDAPANNKWDAPNGVWDSATTIWTEAKILYTDVPVGALASISPATFSVAQNAFTDLEVFFPDRNMNVPQAAGTSFNFTFTGTRGSIGTVRPSTLLDSFGMSMERRLIGVADGKDCAATTPICTFRTLFYSWGLGGVGTLRVVGATTPGPGGASTTALIQSSTTVLQNVVSGGTASGIVQ